MVGPTQGGDGLGFGRGGGWYRRRLERDLGMRDVPFLGRRPSRRGRAATTIDRTVGRRRAATAVVLAGMLLAACGGGGAGRADRDPAADGRLGSQPLVARTPAQFEADLATLRGRVVVVNFWASWCGPCRDEMPALEQVSRDYAGAGRPVTVVGVDVSDQRQAANAFLTKAGVSYPTVFDSKGLSGGVATSWSVTALPQTWFVAPDGTRASRLARPVTAAELRSRIDALLAGS
jgi:thiol-disulfide isomerase/thioredoxin